MTLLVDASALVAMTTREAEARAFANQLVEHDDRLYCAVGQWEATLAVARKQTVTLSDAETAIKRLLADFAMQLVSIGEDESRLAIDAHRRYGKGTGHPAQLNMGDCFAYACARTNNARLLYKGDDFSHTDMA